MLDPDIDRMMKAMQDNGEPPLVKDTTGEEARQRGVEIRARYYPPVLKGVTRIDGRSIPGPAGDIPVRVYWPENLTGATIVFFHGGGWIIGDLDSHDGHARRLASRHRRRRRRPRGVPTRPREPLPGRLRGLPRRYRLGL